MLVGPSRATGLRVTAHRNHPVIPLGSRQKRGGRPGAATFRAFGPFSPGAVPRRLAHPVPPTLGE
jgi:hypothetical protein